MTQIVDERLKKMCDECHSHLDKPCAWLSLGNEYCEEIMNIQQELQKKDNIINAIKEELNKDFNTYICKNKSYGKIFKAGAEIYKEHLLYKIKELEKM